MSKVARTVRAAAALSAASLLAAACGTAATSGTTGTGTSNNSAPTPGVTASQIVLGSTQPLTGPAAPGYSEIAPASNAVFKWVNAHGGINGRKIIYNYVDDAYSPSTTVLKTRQLIAQPIFADFDPLGTPTQLAVQSLLNTDKIPQLFVASGCACWSDPKFPWTSGWQPNYVIEGKILGKYVHSHFPGKKVAYIYQDDEFGQDGVKGLDMEIPSSDVVAREPYAISDLTSAAGLGNQVSKAQAAGAKVVIMFTIPAATAEALLAAATGGFAPQWVVSNVGSDVTTLDGLLSAFSKGKAGGSLLTGLISDDYLPSPADSSNAWIQLFHQIYQAYDNTKVNKFDGNTEYGMAVAFTMVELLKAAGPHLTRQSLISTLNSKGASLAGPGLVPLSYSSTDHYGFQGSRMGTVGASGFVESGPVYETTNSQSAPITTFSGTPSSPPSFSNPSF